jgi:hypothetical protein
MALSTLSTTTYRAPKFYTCHCVHVFYLSRHPCSATSDTTGEGRNQVNDPCIWLHLAVGISKLLMLGTEAGLGVHGADCSSPRLQFWDVERLQRSCCQ